MKFDFYGDNFKWFIGVVKGSFNDKNRVKVRIFGIHRTDDITDVSDDDLPPALVLYPTTGGSTSGGNMSHGLKHGTWVFGFFADGDSCQQPVVVGVIDGGVNAASNLQSDSNRSASGINSDGSLDNTTGSQPASGTLNVQGNGNQEKVYNMVYELIEKSGRSGGDIHAQVCGIMGNIETESNHNPGSNTPDDRGERSYGICQWRGGKYDRLTPLFRMYGTSPTLEQQVSYMWHEFMTSERVAFSKIMSATNVFDATIGMCFFERPQCFKGSYIDTNDSTWKPRIQYANGFYNKMKYKPRDVYSSRGR